MNKKQWLMAAALFFTGALAGALATGLFIQHRIEGFHVKGPPHVRLMFMKRLNDRLDLAPGQRAAVETILNELETRLHEIRTEVDPKLQAAFDRAFDQMTAHLNEAQKTALKDLRRDFPKGCRRGKCIGPSKRRGHPKNLPACAPNEAQTP